MDCSQVIDVLHPNKATVSKKDLKDILAKEYSVNGQQRERRRWPRTAAAAASRLQ
jgi:hypothetical protein